MGHCHFDDVSRERARWNAGKKVGTKRPLTQKQIWAVRFFLDRERRIRDRVLFDPAWRSIIVDRAATRVEPSQRGWLLRRT